MDYQHVLEEIHEQDRPQVGRGAVADHIPALAAVDPGRFGMALATVDGREHAVGDATQPFSIQSVAIG